MVINVFCGGNHCGVAGFLGHCGSSGGGGQDVVLYFHGSFPGHAPRRIICHAAIIEWAAVFLLA